VASLWLHHVPAANPEVIWSLGYAGTGGAIGPTADDHVQRLLMNKPRQTHGYECAWVLLVLDLTIVDADALAAALEAHRAEVPANWARVLLMGSATVWEVFTRT
jgi:hypothetical protein